ncbi:MAG: hypothetical protein AB2794_03910 [Candidatus Thiodiazotropha endolucinida]
MSLKETFSIKSAGPTTLGRHPAYAGAASEKVLSSKFDLARDIEAQKKAEEKKQRDSVLDDLAVMAEEAARQAYEKFNDTYNNAIEFYDKAGQRLDELEDRINERIQEMEDKTELLTDSNGNAVYMDENGGFYKVENAQRVAITESEEIASLNDKVKAIEASGQSVRTESEQDIFVQLQLALTDTLDIGRDAERNRNEADEWKRRVEEDPSQAPEANKSIREGKDDIEKRLKEMEERVNGLDATKDELDRQLTTDQAPETGVIADHRSAFSGASPDTGLGLS